MKKIIFSLIAFVFVTKFNAQCWKSVSTGYDFSIGTRTDGSLWAWGDNSSGQLGNGTNFNSVLPLKVGSDTNWKFIEAGFRHVLAIKTNGDLWAWGGNSCGQVGNGTYTNTNAPQKIGSGIHWQSVSAGVYHSLGVDVNHVLYSWGLNGWGQLGQGITSASFKIPSQVGNEGWLSAAAGFAHSLGIKTDGTLWAWGRNNYGQLGNSAALTSTKSPVQIGVDMDWKYVSAGQYHSFGIKNDGTLWGWGMNSDSQLGDGDTTDRFAPVQIGTDSDWLSVSAGNLHSVGVKTNGTLWAWGSNAAGQAGCGAFILNITVPTQIDAATSWQFASAGRANQSAGIKSDGTIWACGNNYSGQLGDGTTVNKTALTKIESTNCSAIVGLAKLSTNTTDYRIYPNPASNELFINNLSNQAIEKIIVTDIFGKVLLEEKEVASVIDIRRLQTGIYFLKIYSGGKDVSSKFIKE